jgi:hypothetical protein
MVIKNGKQCIVRVIKESSVSRLTVFSVCPWFKLDSPKFGFITISAQITNSF